MKVFIVSALFVIATCSAYSVAPSWGPAPEIHNGVPVETPEVQHAKAAHFAAVAEAQASAGPSNYGHNDGQYAPAPYSSPAYAPQQYAPQQYAPAPVNGVPVETAEVQQAKAAHFAAFAKAQGGSHNAINSYDNGHYAPANVAPAHYGGAPAVPVETPEVQQARAAHLAALAQASGHGAPQYQPAHQYAPAPQYTDSYSHGAPAVPAETPEVQHAKAAHFAAVAAAQSHNDYNQGHSDDGSYRHIDGQNSWDNHNDGHNSWAQNDGAWEQGNHAW